MDSNDKEYLWKDRKRTFLGLPWSFTKYRLSEDRLFIEKGFFKTIYDEVRLYRIMDMELTRTFGQRLFGLGTIHVFSSDKSHGDFDILSVKNSKFVKELLSQQVEKQRDAKRVVNRELMGGEHDHLDDNDFDRIIDDDASNENM